MILIQNGEENHKLKTVVWTDQERAYIHIFSKLNYEDAGPKALQR